MHYDVSMLQVAVLARDRDGAEAVVRRALEERLHGPAGVVDAYLACMDVVPDERLGVPRGATPAQAAAVWRWLEATAAAAQAARDAFPALVLRARGPALEELLSDEFLTIEVVPFPGPIPAPSSAPAERRS